MRSVADLSSYFFFFQAEDGIRDIGVTGVQTCALPISSALLPEDDAGLRAVAGRALEGWEEEGLAAPVALAVAAVADALDGVVLSRDELDRKSVVKGKSVDLGGRRIIKKKNQLNRCSVE